MPAIGERFYERESQRRHRWEIRAIEKPEPEKRKSGRVYLTDKYGASLSLPWAWGVAELEQSDVWKLWFGAK